MNGALGISSATTTTEAGRSQPYSFRRGLGTGHLLAGSPVMVGIIDRAISGVLAAIVCAAPGGVMCLQVAIGLWSNSPPR